MLQGLLFVICWSSAMHNMSKGRHHGSTEQRQSDAMSAVMHEPVLGPIQSLAPIVTVPATDSSQHCDSDTLKET